MRAAALLIALAASPALAQDTSDDLIDDMLARCDTLADDPRAVVDASFDDPDTEAAQTEDGTITFYSSGIEIDDGLYVTHIASRTAFDGGTAVTCSLSAYDRDGTTPYTDMEQVLDARADDILGTAAVTSGGPVYQGGQAGLLRQWSAPGFPPSAMLSLTSSRTFTSVSLQRTYPE